MLVMAIGPRHVGANIPPDNMAPESHGKSFLFRLLSVALSEVSILMKIEYMAREQRPFIHGRGLLIICHYYP